MNTPTPTPQRIIELWPALTPEAQSKLVEMAEQLVAPRHMRKLTAREMAAVDRSRADFAEGRVLDDIEYDAAMASFLSNLETSSAP